MSRVLAAELYEDLQLDLGKGDNMDHPNMTAKEFHTWMVDRLDKFCRDKSPTSRQEACWWIEDFMKWYPFHD